LQVKRSSQWFPTWGTLRAGWEYAKMILVMAENKKKGVKILVQTQKQSHEVLVFKDRLM
jgi:hypothetical protein